MAKKREARCAICRKKTDRWRLEGGHKVCNRCAVQPSSARGSAEMDEALHSLVEGGFVAFDPRTGSLSLTAKGEEAGAFIRQNASPQLRADLDQVREKAEMRAFERALDQGEQFIPGGREVAATCSTCQNPIVLRQARTTDEFGINDFRPLAYCCGALWLEPVDGNVVRAERPADLPGMTGGGESAEALFDIMVMLAGGNSALQEVRARR